MWFILYIVHWVHSLTIQWFKNYSEELIELDHFHDLLQFLTLLFSDKAPAGLYGQPAFVSVSGWESSVTVQGKGNTSLPMPSPYLLGLSTL
jgi:hypothetical protein